jgi:hypothetical protein
VSPKAKSVARPVKRAKPLDPIIEIRKDGDMVRVRLQGVRARVIAKGEYKGMITPDQKWDLQYQIQVGLI